jgi:hypothetical protein
MLIHDFDRACEEAERQANRRQEAYVVFRLEDEPGHRVEARAHACEDELLFTAEPDPLKAPRKFWPLVLADAVTLTGDAAANEHAEKRLHARADRLRGDRGNSVKVTRRKVKADHASVPLLILTCRRKPGH